MHVNVPEGVGGMAGAPDASFFPLRFNHFCLIRLASGRSPTQRAAAAGLKPAERGPGGGLTATYCTPWGMSKNTTPPTRNAYFYVEDGAKLGSSWGQVAILRPSWRHLGGQDEAMMGPSWAQVAILSHLEGNFGPKLGPSWAKLGSSCHLEGIWRQLGGHLA